MGGGRGCEVKAARLSTCFLFLLDKRSLCALRRDSGDNRQNNGFRVYQTDAVVPPY